MYGVFKTEPPFCAGYVFLTTSVIYHLIVGIMWEGDVVTDPYSDLLKGLYTSGFDSQTTPSRTPPVDFSRKLLLRMDALEHRVQEVADAVRAVLDELNVSQLIESLNRAESLSSQIADLSQRLDELSKQVDRLYRLFVDLNNSEHVRELVSQLREVNQQFYLYRKDLLGLYRQLLDRVPLEKYLKKVGRLSEDELLNLPFDSTGYAITMEADGKFHVIDKWGNVYELDPNNAPLEVYEILHLPPVYSTYNPSLPVRKWRRPRRVRRSRSERGESTD